MSEKTLNECPESDVLEQFLRGKLQPPLLEDCESHLKDCRLCHETLAGLSGGDDTLTERLIEVLRSEVGNEVGNVEEGSVRLRNPKIRTKSKTYWTD